MAAPSPSTPIPTAGAGRRLPGQHPRRPRGLARRLPRRHPAAARTRSRRGWRRPAPPPAGLDHRACGGEDFNVLVVPPATADAPIDVYQISPQGRRGHYPARRPFQDERSRRTARVAASRGFTNACLDVGGAGARGRRAAGADRGHPFARSAADGDPRLPVDPDRPSPGRRRRRPAAPVRGHARPDRRNPALARAPARPGESRSLIQLLIYNRTAGSCLC